MYSVLNKVTRRSKKRTTLPPRLPLSPAMEAVYQSIVCRDLARLGLDDVFYPVGYAANYGLFYAILRAIIDFRFETVVELGAGQSSLLLDALSRKELLRAQVRTFEHDDQWATRIGSRVSHAVTTLPLRERSEAGLTFSGYDFQFADTGSIDFLIVDGPAASTTQTQYSRLGALDLVKSINQSRFVIVVDDAERTGERILVDQMVRALTSSGAAPVVGHVVANKRQAIIAGGAYVGAAYY